MRNAATLMLVVLTVLFLGACTSAKEVADGGGGATMTMAQQLVAKHIEANGGLETIRRLQSIKMDGEVYMPAAGMTMPLTITQQRPTKMHLKVSIPAMGAEVIQAYDGETAWANNPMQGGVQKLTGEEADRFVEQADIDGILVNAEAKGYKVGYVGEAQVNDLAAQKLSIMRPDSSEIFVYLDATSFLQLKTESEGTNPMDGSTAMVATYMNDYREVDGMMMPFGMEVLMDGETFQTITIKEVKTNVEVDDSIFMYPKK